ncbi:TspO/MBR family protein [Aestuariivivens sp. NBU2969]|uniref:TspO/MBR family protein n=1 Tax=Aestuariivivens sp. NBU2969 TaxID=2873267 RepID=UPI001CBF9A29|nr:TspO/MBR family protein [Aestuariivivens sp. NBU2969]
MKILKYLIFFLVINFGALTIGGWLMNNGPLTAWYQNLNQAPWTPPSWVFGIAWTTIMICFSIYMAYLAKIVLDKKLVVLFTIQFILNVVWNYIFFNQHLTILGLVCLIILTFVIGKFLLDYKSVLKIKSLLILPYFIWLIVAISLNAYIVLKN